VIGKAKAIPLINTDDTDLRKNCLPGGAVYAGIPGVDLCKTFGILVGVEGGGMVRSAPIAVVARDRRHRT
jgi:hypothetical protein